MTTAEMPAPPLPWQPAPPRRRIADALALTAWTTAVVAFFWDVVTLRRALFYFDITEINYPYRYFFAEELKAGRFSRWIPSLYCGHPLYSESQAGYLHPFKYLFYPWLPTWQALNLECVLSVWLTGVFTYGWLRRHVGPAGALTGAALMALSGFTWAHFVHTSMLNALVSVPLAFWGLELAWSGRYRRGIAMAAIALACQIFAGHLQDAILTGLALGVYGLYRAAVDSGFSRRVWTLAAVLLIGVLGILLSAVQWVPSKELIDRSPRAGGLTWSEITYGSWHPELIPTVLVRQAYGTRARDTDWMDGFYPYHEMNVFLGIVGLALAVVGAGAYRDRWVGGWLVLGGVGFLLMLGRFTFLFDVMPHVPIIGTGRVPVRYHLWVVVSAAALAAVGVDRLARAGPSARNVSLRPAFRVISLLALVSIPILFHIYETAWTERARWPLRYHAERYAWLTEELIWSVGLTITIGAAAWAVAAAALRAHDPARRARLAAALPLLLIAELLGAHATDVPAVDPEYWTTTPDSAQWLKNQPSLRRVFGEGIKASGEPGYASHGVDFMAVRELLAWSLPPAWNLDTTNIATPIRSARRLRFDDEVGPIRFPIEGLSHVVTSAPDAASRLGPGTRVGTVSIHPVPNTLPRARLIALVEYAEDADQAAAALRRLALDARDVLVVEDPDKPLPPGGPAVAGSATIVDEVPEQLTVEVEADTPAYLFLADSFDPGWSASVDEAPAPIHPAHLGFRAVLVPAGTHSVRFTYEPAGFRLGLAISLIGLAAVCVLLAIRRTLPPLSPAHGPSPWPARWPWMLAGLMLLVVVASIPRLAPDGRGLTTQARWDKSWHRFTWGAGIEAMGLTLSPGENHTPSPSPSRASPFLATPRFASSWRDTLDRDGSAAPPGPRDFSRRGIEEPASTR